MGFQEVIEAYYHIHYPIIRELYIIDDYSGPYQIPDRHIFNLDDFLTDDLEKITYEISD